jgi:hypothetical protein
VKHTCLIHAVVAMTAVSGLWSMMPAEADATTVLDSATWSGNSHTYYLIAGGSLGSPAGISWSDAEAYAVNTLGGHLATVDSSPLDNWIWGEFGNAMNRNLWIGLTDRVTENQFKWIATGEALSYAHWYPGEPNNYGNEDYVFILKSGFSGGNGAGEGTWNDGQAGWTEFFGAPIYAIAETTAPPVPEPLTILGLCLGTGAVGGYLKRRSHRP